MPFDSRKQQQWYNATDQDYLDNEPSSSRQLEEFHPQDKKDTMMDEIDLDKLFGDNFVKKDTERFGEGTGGSLDHFYDKIFEALSVNDIDDSGGAQYSQSIVDELNKKGIIFLDESEDDHDCQKDEHGDCVCPSCDTDADQYSNMSCKTCKRSKGYDY